MRRDALPALAALALLAGGCSPSALLQRAAGTPEGAFARETLDLALRRDAAALTARLTPDVAAAATPATMSGIFGEIPAGQPSPPELIGYESFRSAAVTRAQFTYEYRFPGAWLLGLVVVDTTTGSPRVAGLHLRRMPDSLSRINAFTLRGRSVGHFAMIAAGAAAVGLTIHALAACLRTRGLRRKWLWMLFIGVGMGRLMLNWTTGDVRGQALWIQVLGVAVTRSGLYGPWIVSVSLPLGALVFLLRRRRIRGAAERERLDSIPSAFE